MHFNLWCSAMAPFCRLLVNGLYLWMGESEMTHVRVTCRWGLLVNGWYSIHVNTTCRWQILHVDVSPTRTVCKLVVVDTLNYGVIENSRPVVWYLIIMTLNNCCIDAWRNYYICDVLWVILLLVWYCEIALVLILWNCDGIFIVKLFWYWHCSEIIVSCWD